MQRIAFLICLLITCHGYCEEYFQQCSDVLKNNAYIKLKEYTETKKISPQLCQRLNNSEFLYTAGEGYWIYFYYCKDSETNGLDCTQDGYSHYPDVRVEKRFSSKSGKQFVLFKSSQLSRGVYGEGFTIFHLIPKYEEGAGYALYALEGAGQANGSYSNAGKVCSNMGDADAITFRNPPYEILDKNEKVIIRFNQDVVSCDGSHAAASQVLEYIWQSNRFRLLNDSRKYQ